MDSFVGAPTETMTSKQAILDKLVLETYVNIIKGAPISEFDAMVNQWKQLGGDDMTEEVNEWYSNS